MYIDMRNYLPSMALLLACLMSSGCTVLAVAGAATSVVVGVGSAAVAVGGAAVGAAVDVAAAGVHAVAGSAQNK